MRFATGFPACRVVCMAQFGLSELTGSGWPPGNSSIQPRTSETTCRVDETELTAFLTCKPFTDSCQTQSRLQKFGPQESAATPASAATLTDDQDVWYRFDLNPKKTQSGEPDCVCDERINRPGLTPGPDPAWRRQPSQSQRYWRP
jgi:hypothetical protein